METTFEKMAVGTVFILKTWEHCGTDKKALSVDDKPRILRKKMWKENRYASGFAEDIKDGEAFRVNADEICEVIT